MAAKAAYESAVAIRGEGGHGRSMILCFLLVFAGFTLTSTTYLAWLYNLMNFPEAGSVEAITMVGGYGFQALGLGIVAVLGSRWSEVFSRVPFVSVVALHFMCAAPAMMSGSLEGTLAFGFLMNLMCGAIAANYLYRLAADVRKGRRGTVFGCAYACSTLASWLLSLIPDLHSTGNSTILVPCILLSALAAGVAIVPSRGAGRAQTESESSQGAVSKGWGFLAVQSAAKNGFRVEPRSLVTFACLAVLLMSLVNNIGFVYPTAEIASGVSLELSRLFYAVALVIAGVVIDRSFKYGTFCCVIALIMPFALMALADEPIPATIVWGLNYLSAGFFSVFRVVLFADIASETRLLHLSCLGLMVGRIGDALGTAVFLTLGGNAIALVSVATVLFAASVFVVYRLSQLILSEEATLPQKSEQELLREFAARYELSARECDVLELLLDGRSNSEVAAELFVSESTVKFHVHNLLKKTGCKNRNELRSAVLT